MCVGSLACCCATRALSCLCVPSSLRPSVAARVYYALGFALTSLVAVVLYQPWTHAALIRMRVIKTGNEVHEPLACVDQPCWSYVAVARLSLASVLYHAVLALVTVRIRRTHNSWRAALHNGLWIVKIALWIALVSGISYVPAGALFPYAIPSVLFSALFILLQSMVLVDFCWKWAESWIQAWEDADPDDTAFYKYRLIGCCLTMYALFITITVLLFVYCMDDLNVYFVSTNIVLCGLLSVISVLPWIQEALPGSGLFQSSFISLYLTYLVATAAQTHYIEQNPDTNHQQDTTVAIISLLVSYIAIAYSAFSTGTSALYTSLPISESSSSPVPSSDDETSPSFMNRLQSALASQPDDEDDQVEYNYAFFHLVFAMASFYILMVVTGWSSVHVSDPNSSQPTVSIESILGVVWVKMVSSWLCAVLYVWTLVAPLVLPDREFF